MHICTCPYRHGFAHVWAPVCTGVCVGTCTCMWACTVGSRTGSTEGLGVPLLGLRLWAGLGWGPRGHRPHPGQKLCSTHLQLVSWPPWPSGCPPLVQHPWPSVQGLCLPRPAFWGFSVLRVQRGGLGGPRPPAGHHLKRLPAPLPPPSTCSRELWLRRGQHSRVGLPPAQGCWRLEEGHYSNSCDWPSCWREARRVPRGTERPAGRARSCWGPGHCSSRHRVSASQDEDRLW